MCLEINHLYNSYIRLIFKLPKGSLILCDQKYSTKNDLKKHLAGIHEKEQSPYVSSRGIEMDLPPPSKLLFDLPLPSEILSTYV